MGNRGSLGLIVAVVAAVTAIVLLSTLPPGTSTIGAVEANTTTPTPEPWSPDPWENESDKAWLVKALSGYDVYLLGDGVIAGLVRDAFKWLGCEDKLVSLSVDEVGVYHGDNSILFVDGAWLARNLDEVSVKDVIDTARYVCILYLSPNVTWELMKALEGRVDSARWKLLSRSLKRWAEIGYYETMRIIERTINGTVCDPKLIPYAYCKFIDIAHEGGLIKVNGPVGWGGDTTLTIKETIKNHVIWVLIQVVTGYVW